eukprot:TRINITY_DN4907_c0_g1_i3.p2 TRINITY_DN4907_c0_g1~~TRINITY_DN4907_c0_g1_i3.p2  ORF type:complete len:218 (-),score=-13.69 TRINITY_DN4907_c0_g1_i3:97-750(-)
MRILLLKQVHPYMHVLDLAIDTRMQTYVLRRMYKITYRPYNTDILTASNSKSPVLMSRRKMQYASVCILTDYFFVLKLLLFTQPVHISFGNNTVKKLQNKIYILKQLKFKFDVQKSFKTTYLKKLEISSSCTSSTTTYLEVIGLQQQSFFMYKISALMLQIHDNYKTILYFQQNGIKQSQKHIFYFNINIYKSQDSSQPTKNLEQSKLQLPGTKFKM